MRLMFRRKEMVEEPLDRCSTTKGNYRIEKCPELRTLGSSNS